MGERERERKRERGIEIKEREMDKMRARERMKNRGEKRFCNEDCRIYWDTVQLFYSKLFSFRNIGYSVV